MIFSRAPEDNLRISQSWLEERRNRKWNCYLLFSSTNLSQLKVMWLLYLKQHKLWCNELFLFFPFLQVIFMFANSVCGVQLLTVALMEWTAVDKNGLLKAVISSLLITPVTVVLHYHQKKMMLNQWKPQLLHQPGII